MMIYQQQQNVLLSRRSRRTYSKTSINWTDHLLISVITSTKFRSFSLIFFKCFFLLLILLFLRLLSFLQILFNIWNCSELFFFPVKNFQIFKSSPKLCLNFYINKVLLNISKKQGRKVNCTWIKNTFLIFWLNLKKLSLVSPHRCCWFELMKFAW